MSGDFELHHWRPRHRSSKSSIVHIPNSLHLEPLSTHPASRVSPNGDGAGYTSLSEIIHHSPSAAVSSPSNTVAGEIRIRNRLVKQAAYAYLQPTPSATEAASRRRRCCSLRRCLGVIGSCFGGFIGRLLRAIHIRMY